MQILIITNDIAKDIAAPLFLNVRC